MGWGAGGEVGKDGATELDGRGVTGGDTDWPAEGAGDTDGDALASDGTAVGGDPTVGGMPESAARCSSG